MFMQLILLCPMHAKLHALGKRMSLFGFQSQTSTLEVTVYIIYILRYFRRVEEIYSLPIISDQANELQKKINKIKLSCDFLMFRKLKRFYRIKIPGSMVIFLPVISNVTKPSVEAFKVPVLPSIQAPVTSRIPGSSLQ